MSNFHFLLLLSSSVVIQINASAQSQHDDDAAFEDHTYVVSLEAPLEVRLANVAAPQTLRHVRLEQSLVRLQNLRRVLVQRIIGIGLQEQVLQPIDNRVDGQDGLPVLAQNVQANVALQVDVRMVHLRFALDLGRFMGVVGAHLEVESETS